MPGGCAVDLAGQSDLYICVFIYIYLLFTMSIHTVHPQISMVQLIAPSQTVNEMFDGNREREGGGVVGRRGTVFSLKRRQQEMAPNISAYKLNLAGIQCISK